MQSLAVGGQHPPSASRPPNRDTGGRVLQRSHTEEHSSGTHEGTGSESSHLTVGDTVQTTDNLHIRGGPGTDEPIRETTPVGVTGDIVGGPTTADGYTWWQISYHAGYEGWSAQPWLDRTEATAVTGQASDGPGEGDAGVGTGASEAAGKTTTTEYLPPLHYYDKVVTIDYHTEQFGPGEITREIDLSDDHEYDGVYIVQTPSKVKKHYWK